MGQTLTGNIAFGITVTPNKALHLDLDGERRVDDSVYAAGDDDRLESDWIGVLDYTEHSIVFTKESHQWVYGGNYIDFNDASITEVDTTEWMKALNKFVKDSGIPMECFGSIGWKIWSTYG